METQEVARMFSQPFRRNDQKTCAPNLASFCTFCQELLANSMAEASMDSVLKLIGRECSGSAYNLPKVSKSGMMAIKLNLSHVCSKKLNCFMAEVFASM